MTASSPPSSLASYKDVLFMFCWVTLFTAGQQEVISNYLNNNSNLQQYFSHLGNSQNNNSNLGRRSSSPCISLHCRADTCDLSGSTPPIEIWSGRSWAFFSQAVLWWWNAVQRDQRDGNESSFLSRALGDPGIRLRGEKVQILFIIIVRVKEL